MRATPSVARRNASQRSNAGQPATAGQRSKAGQRSNASEPGNVPGSTRPPKAAAPNGSGTKSRILDAAEALFVEHGFEATSMRALSAAAGVNLAAVNYHF